MNGQAQTGLGTNSLDIGKQVTQVGGLDWRGTAGAQTLPLCATGALGASLGPEIGWDLSLLLEPVQSQVFLVGSTASILC
jgi:hypothetical protein